MGDDYVVARGLRRTNAPNFRVGIHDRKCGVSPIGFVLGQHTRPGRRPCAPQDAEVAILAAWFDGASRFPPRSAFEFL